LLVTLNSRTSRKSFLYLHKCVVYDTFSPFCKDNHVELLLGTKNSTEKRGEAHAYRLFAHKVVRGGVYHCAVKRIEGIRAQGGLGDSTPGWYSIEKSIRF